MKVNRLFVVLLVILCLAGCGNKEELPKETPEADIGNMQEQEVISDLIPEVSDIPVSEDTTESLPVIYDGDEHINLYLNRYNEANPDSSIESSDFEIYNHHGQDHKDQITYTLNDFEYIISSIGLKLQVDIQGELHSGKSVDDYRQEFFKYAKGYNTSLTDDILSEYWDQAVSNATSFTEFDEFEVYLRKDFDDNIEALSIEGEVN